MLRQRLGPALVALLIPILSAATAFVMTRPPSPLVAAERLFEAGAFRAVGPVRPERQDVVIIGITEETLDQLPYRSPIDRAFLAELIRSLEAAGVSAIGLDVLLDRPTEPAKDAALRRALREANVPITVITLTGDTPLPEERRRFLASFAGEARRGNANLARDRFDDVVRMHVPVDPATGTLSFPTAVAASLGAPVPTQPFPIAWRRSPGGPPFPTYPAGSVPLLPPGWLSGKAVLIGAMIPGTDEHRTLLSAFGRPSFGVEIHGTVLAQLLERRAEPAPHQPWIGGGALFVMALAGAGLGWWLAGYAAAAALGGLSVLFLAGVVVAYAWTGVLLPPLAPLLALILAGGGTRAWLGRQERRDRQALRSLFSRFVSEPVVQEIMRERDLFMAGGRPRPQQLTATVMFADVAGFTSICERMQPEPLIAWLDLYIDTMAGIIMEHHGVLLRFIGDGILAVFGVPIPRRDEAAITEDARNAARCALAMEEAMERLNDLWHATGQPEAGLRVGLHTGPMVAGSLGTGPRMEFCLLGDTANTGARLEQVGKEHAPDSGRYCTIVVGGPTWERLGGLFPGLEIGELTLRGKREVLAAYRIDREAARRAREGVRVCDHTSASEMSSSAS
ncbi:MAG: CHASE2 domain-containing protein [Gammaproteobacteria bacterium]